MVSRAASSRASPDAAARAPKATRSVRPRCVERELHHQREAAGRRLRESGLGLGDGQDPVGLHVAQALDDPAGPADLDGADLPLGPQAEVDASVAGGEIAGGGADGGLADRPRGGDHPDVRADAVAVAAPADQPELDPVAAVAALVQEDPGPVVERAHHDVHVAVVVEVPGGQPAGHPGGLEDLARLRRDVPEAPLLVSGQERGLPVLQVRRGQLDGVEHVAPGQEEVLPPVVVVVEEADAPAGGEQADAPDAGGVGVVREGPVPGVAVERPALVGEVRDDDVGPAVVVVVGEVDPHAREGPPVLVEGGEGQQRHLLERGVAPVPVEELPDGVVGHEDVGEPVPVEVGQGHAQGLPFGVGHPRRRGDVGEGPISRVAVEERGGALEEVGVTVGAGAAGRGLGKGVVVGGAVRVVAPPTTACSGPRRCPAGRRGRSPRRPRSWTIVRPPPRPRRSRR